MSVKKVNYIIYGLIHPITKEIRYVGKCKYGFYRLSEHLHPHKLQARTRKNNWIKSLLAENLKPEIILLMKSNANEVDFHEKEMIALLNGSGRLTNGTAGGTGGDTGKAYLKWVPIEATCVSTGKKTNYRSITEAANDGFNRRTIWSICNGQNSVHKGYTFRYINYKPTKAVDVNELTAFGETKSISEWVKDSRCFVNANHLISRLNRGWDGERAMSQMARCNLDVRPIEEDLILEELSIMEIALKHNVCKTIVSRVNKRLRERLNLPPRKYIYKKQQ